MLLDRSALISSRVLSGQIRSEQVDLYGYTKVGLLVPTITSSPITFEVGALSGFASGNTLKDSSGSTLSLPAATGSVGISDGTLSEALGPWRYAHIIVQAQADGRLFLFVLKA